MAIDDATVARLIALYPALGSIDDGERQQVLSTDAALVTAPAGVRLFEEGQPCRGFPLVLRGSVRVVRGSPDGRHIELYRVTPGEMCVVSTSCLFGSVPLTAHGLTAEHTELIQLSAAGFTRWSQQEEFRRFAFGVLANRLADLMALAEAVAFQRLDQRLAGALLGRGPALQVTHQDLADELGTVREIVTRLLRRFETAGWVSLSRGRITIADAHALRALAGG